MRVQLAVGRIKNVESFVLVMVGIAAGVHGTWFDCSWYLVLVFCGRLTVHFLPVHYFDQLATGAAFHIGRYKFQRERTAALDELHGFAAPDSFNHAAKLAARRMLRKDTKRNYGIQL